MEEKLYVEDEMRIEMDARKAFLSVAEYGTPGIDHFMKTLVHLKQRLIEAEKCNSQD